MARKKRMNQKELEVWLKDYNAQLNSPENIKAADALAKAWADAEPDDNGIIEVDGYVLQEL